jgi:hypothetical protein
MSQYWATIAQRHLADGIFPDIQSMDEYSKGFYDLLRRPQYGLRFKLVSNIANQMLEHNTIQNMSCPFGDDGTGLW